MNSLGNRWLDEFASFIFKNLGIVFNDSNRYQLETRIKNIKDQFEITSDQDLHQRLVIDKDPTLINYFLDLATNNETSFFRDPKVFQAIQEHIILPFARNDQGTLQIWSAACSTGQEPYSLAMELSEVENQFPGFSFHIDATDISSRALQRAESARFSQIEVQRGLSSLYLVKHFQKVDKSVTNADAVNCWQLKPEIRKHISFQKFNLLDDVYPRQKYDLIMCRNVLIYQPAEHKLTILKKLSQALKPCGYLILGCAETLFGFETNFRSIPGLDVLIYQNQETQTQKAS